MSNPHKHQSLSQRLFFFMDESNILGKSHESPTETSSLQHHLTFMNKELVLQVPREEIKQWELREGPRTFTSILF